MEAFGTSKFETTRVHLPNLDKDQLRSPPTDIPGSRKIQSFQVMVNPSQ
jgi:hypothetical protein